MLLLAVALSAVTVDATTPPTTSLDAIDAACPSARPHIAVQRGKSPPLKKLNELPPANMYSAVYRLVNGCEKPIVVRYDVGRR